MKVTLLDGGMGQELIHRAGDRPTPLWSTQVMMDHPGMVAEVHRDYAAAGASVATMNTYAIHRDRLIREGIEDRFEALHAAAVAEVRDIAGRKMGSIGPLVASYRPDIEISHEEAVAKFREVVDLLVPVSDVIGFETVSSIAQARAALAAASGCGKPVWIAFTLDDEDGTRLRSGEGLAEAAQMAADEGADAVLVNCCAPEVIGVAMDILRPIGLPFGGYANAFTQITKGFLQDAPTADALQARRDMGPVPYAEFAMAWVGQGATIVGGCCETGPAHIAEIAGRLKAAGHEIV